MDSVQQICLLIQQIEKDFTAALKTGDQAAVAALRLLKTALKNAAIEKRGPLIQEEAQKIVQGEIRKRQDSIEAFKKGNREDLVLAEESGLKVLEKYLPPQLSEAEIKQIIQKQISQLGEVSSKDFGKVMGAAMSALRGRADGEVVSRLVKEVVNRES